VWWRRRLRVRRRFGVMLIRWFEGVWGMCI
jgi:hypothetical protein